MDNSNYKVEKLKAAQKRIKKIKKFYFKVVKLIIFTILLFVLKGRLFQSLIDKGLDDSNFLKWLDWNLMLIPAFIALILMIQGLRLFVFNSFLIKKWENKQIEKIMKEE